MIVVVRLSPLAKNVPQRNRAGHQFTHEPTVADVNAEQLKIIQGDPYLKVCNFPSVAWFEAMSIERTQVNEDTFKDEKGVYVPPTKIPKDARKAPKVGTEGKGTPVAGKTAPAPTGGQGEGTGKKVDDNKPKELSASSPIDDLVQALVKKGKVEGKDFSKTSKPESLFAMLKTL